MNMYERAIFEVGAVLEGYTFDQKFHATGFGGAPNYLEDELENGKNSKCWNLDGSPICNIVEAKVPGTTGILSTYRNAVT